MKKPEDMSEAYFRKHVIDPWLNKHAEYWFPTTGVNCRNGMPDYCCVINGKPVFIEAKKATGVLSAYQINEIEKLYRKHIIVKVVNPFNWRIISNIILEETKK